LKNSRTVFVLSPKRCPSAGVGAGWGLGSAEELDVSAGGGAGSSPWELGVGKVGGPGSGSEELNDVRKSIIVGDDILDGGRVGASELEQPSFRSLFAGEPVRLGDYKLLSLASYSVQD
jgi:hypothetical protein